MEEQTSDVIWEGLVGLNNYKAKIHVIEPHVLRRGLLKIYSLEDELLYQKEVPVDRRQKFGGTSVEFQAWNKEIKDWVLNSSPHRPRAIFPSNPEE